MRRCEEAEDMVFESQRLIWQLLGDVDTCAGCYPGAKHGETLICNQRGNFIAFCLDS
jgi:hypothetical protein